MKDLPRGPTEKNEPDALRKPRIRNMMYPVKVMYLGVIACTQDEDNFDDRIVLERVWYAKVQTHASKNKIVWNMCI